VYTPVNVVSTAIANVVLKISAGMPTGTYTRVRVGMPQIPLPGC